MVVTKEIALQREQPQIDLVKKLIQTAFQNYGKSRRALIPLLQVIQDNLGYLPEWSLELVSNHSDIPLSTIYGICTFYHQFTLKPLGEYVIQLCMGTACHIRGNAENYAFLQKLLDLNPRRKTTEDGMFTLVDVRCLGCCSLAPVMKVNDDIYGKVDFKTIRKVVSKYKSETKRKPRPELKVFTVKLGGQEFAFKRDELENLKRTSLRWSVLKCLHTVLCDARLDMPHSIESDLEVIRSIIETGCRRIRDADGLLSWVENKLIAKAIALNNIVYWEDLLRKVDEDKLTKEEIATVPYMEAAIKRYEFLVYCTPAKTDRDLMT